MHFYASLRVRQATPSATAARILHLSYTRVGRDANLRPGPAHSPGRSCDRGWRFRRSRSRTVCASASGTRTVTQRADRARCTASVLTSRWVARRETKLRGRGHSTHSAAKSNGAHAGRIRRKTKQNSGGKAAQCKCHEYEAVLTLALAGGGGVDATT